MSNVLTKINNYLLIILFFLLPIIHSYFFNFLWINWWFYVSWNFEFTKVMFFNIVSWIILWLYFLWLIYDYFWNNTSSLKSLSWKKEKTSKKFIVPKSIYFIVPVIIISTIFSSSFFTSLLWNTSKSHSAIMFINLIWIFIILINSDKNLLKKLLLTTFISSIFVWIIWIKEYYFPTFNYWDLSNRAIWTFGHPNYLALYILILIPLLLRYIKDKKINILKNILLILLIILLFLTKSAWWIIIFLLYIFSKNISKLRKKDSIIWLLFIFIVITIIYNYIWFLYTIETSWVFTTKLHSFLSRFFIWETTLKIIFSDLKIILFGWWLWTLEFIFDSFKWPYLYIFENIWFTADRPHNLFLNFFYHFWILWLFLIIFIFSKIIKIYKVSLNNKLQSKNIPYLESLILFFTFTIFNFSWITQYLIILLMWTIVYKNYVIPSEQTDHTKKSSIILPKILLITFFIFISMFWFHFYLSYYIEEYKSHIDNNDISSNYLYNRIKLEDYEKNLFGKWFKNIEDMCKKIINYSSSVENYFYCWDLLWKNNKKLANEYYTKWFNKLPDLWNKNSKYNNQFLIKHFVDKKRFFSTKYSNINEILNKLWK